MRPDRWERIAAGTGIAVVAIGIVAFVVVPVSPKLSELDKLATYVGEHRKGIITQAYLLTIGTMFMLWFAGALRSALRRAEGGTGRLSTVAFGGAVAASSIIVLTTSLYAAAAFRGAEDTARLQLFADVGAIAFTFVAIPIAVFVGATALVSWRTGVLPRWHAVLGAITATAFAASGALVYGSTGFWSIDSPTSAGTYMTLLFLVWILATSIMLMVGESEVVQPATTEDHAKVVWHLRKAG